MYRTQDGSPRPDYENVRDSGKLFRQYTLVNKSDADAVHDLIMATANQLQASSRLNDASAPNINWLVWKEYTAKI